MEWLRTVAAVCVFVFAHLCVSVIFWSSGSMRGVGFPVGLAVYIAYHVTMQPQCLAKDTSHHLQYVLPYYLLPFSVILHSVRRSEVVADLNGQQVSANTTLPLTWFERGSETAQHR